MGKIIPKKNRRSMLGNFSIVDLQSEVSKDNAQNVESDKNVVSDNAVAKEKEDERPNVAVMEQQSENLAGNPIADEIIQEEPYQQIRNQQKVEEFNQGVTQNRPMINPVYQPQYQPNVNINMVPNPQPVKNTYVPKLKPGRKRLSLIPGDTDKSVYLELPSTLITIMQQYAYLNNMSMKELIGKVLIEKFMK